MDLDAATQAHTQWKVKLRMAISQQQTLDLATIKADNCCPLGQWLHGEAKGLDGRIPAYRDCVTRHAAFHSAAASVGEAINQKRYAQPEKMLEPGTPYAAATTAVASAILGLKKAAAGAPA